MPVGSLRNCRRRTSRRHSEITVLMGSLAIVAGVPAYSVICGVNEAKGFRVGHTLRVALS